MANRSRTVTGCLALAAAMAGGVAVLACRSGGGSDAEPAGRSVAPGLSNLGRVDDGLWRSGQPTAEGFAAARAMGIRTVVNLRSAHSDRDLAAGTGLELVEIPTHQWDVDEGDLAAFLKIATDPARRPVLVHCAEGRDRTGVAVAAYRRVVDGWTAHRALEEMRAYGAAPWWVNLSFRVERIDPDALRARVARTPPPAVVLAR